IFRLMPPTSATLMTTTSPAVIARHPAWQPHPNNRVRHRCSIGRSSPFLSSASLRAHAQKRRIRRSRRLREPHRPEAHEQHPPELFVGPSSAPLTSVYHPALTSSR